MIDLYNDPAHGRLKQILPNFPRVAPLLKHAEFEDSRDEIPPSAFADLSGQRFPTHTPEHAVVSFLYANAQGAPAGVMSKIAEALYAYNIDPAVFTPSGVKVAEAAPTPSLFDDGTYPVGSVEQVKMAEVRLLEEVGKVPLASRVRVFNKLAHAASDLGVELSPRGQAWGMSAHCNPDVLARNVEARATLCKTAEHQRAYLDLASSIRDDPRALREYAVRVKVAETLLGLDEAAGVTTHYERAIPDPLCSVFNRPAKLGEQLVILGQNAYDMTQILGLPLHFFHDTLGPEVVSEVAPGGVLDAETLLAVLPTLPADSMAHFEQGLQSAGIRPTGV